MSRFAKYFVNRNPRNLDQLRVAWKPQGYQFESDGQLKHYFYRLELERKGKHTTGLIRHRRDGVVLSASTQEPELANRLYRTNDLSAVQNVGRVLARRCQQAGIYQVMNGVASTSAQAVSTDTTAQTASRKRNVEAASVFLEALSDAGIELHESNTIKPSYSMDPRFHFVEERKIEQH